MYSVRREGLLGQVGQVGEGAGAVGRVVGAIDGVQAHLAAVVQGDDGAVAGRRRAGAGAGAGGRRLFGERFGRRRADSGVSRVRGGRLAL